MSSQIVEREIISFIGELQQRGQYCDAALLEMELFHAKGYLPDLIRIRDHWDSAVNHPSPSEKD